jgi:hypothetical protein
MSPRHFDGNNLLIPLTEVSDEGAPTIPTAFSLSVKIFRVNLKIF